MKFLLIIFFLVSPKLFAWHVGVGYSSMTNGRAVPALNAGGNISPKWMISGNSVGVRNDYYYMSGYTLAALYEVFRKEAVGGLLTSGIGPGLYYADKGIVKSEEDLSLDRNRDFMMGPAFRVQFRFFKNAYFAAEYVMGISTMSILNTWADTGVVCVGVIW